jgi:hypothetical protein
VGFKVIERLAHLYARLPIDLSPGTRLLLTIIANAVIDKDYDKTGVAECELEGKRLRELTGLDRSSVHRSFIQIEKICICEQTSDVCDDSHGILTRRDCCDDDHYTLHLGPADISRLHTRRLVREFAVAGCDSQVATRTLQPSEPQVAITPLQVATPHQSITTEGTEKNQSPARSAGPADAAVTAYSEAYKTHYNGIPPELRKGDYVQFANLRRRLGIDARASPQDWETAITNYFASDRGSHTLADLCTQYAKYRMHKLDRYNRPIGGQNHETGNR